LGCHVKGQTPNVETFHGYGVMILKEVDPSVGRGYRLRRSMWGVYSGEEIYRRDMKKVGSLISTNQISAIPPHALPPKHERLPGF